MYDYTAPHAKQICINAGRKSIFYNLNDVCYFDVKSDQVSCILTNKKIIPILHNFETIKVMLLQHNFVQVGQFILINQDEIKSVRNCGDNVKVYTKSNIVIDLDENYITIKKALLLK